MKVAAKISLIYVGICSLYIVFSDMIVLQIFSSAELITYIQSYKGITFVLASGVLIFWLTSRHFTEISRANETLEQTISYHRMIFEKNPLPSFILDQDTLRYLRVNEAAQLLFGRSEQEYQAHTAMDFVAGIDRDEILSLRDQINEGGYLELTLDGLAKDRSIINQRVFCQKILVNGVDCIICMALDITSIKDSEEMIMDKMLDILEDDRKRIAREIHDSLKQYFGLTNGLLKSIRSSDIPEKLLARSIELTEKGIEESRRLSHSITPALGEFDILASLAYLIENLNYLSGSRFTLSGSLENQYSHEARLNVYRIVQEATSNIRLHSGAKTASIELTERDDFLHLKISDDGRGLEKGFTSRSLQSIGLASMRTRATKLSGFFTLQSEPGQGTTLHVRIPIVKNRMTT